MCEFWSAVVSRTGKVYHLGEITSHEKCIEHFKLRDTQMQEICRIEIPIINGFDLKPRKEWNLKIDETEKPTWWNPEIEQACFKELERFHKKEFLPKWKRFKKLNAGNEKLAKMKGEQIIWREKLEPFHEKEIVKYYLLGEKNDWNSVWDSVWDSVRDSVRDSVWDSVWNSVWDSVWNSVRNSVWNSVWNSVRNSVRNSVWDSVRNSVRELQFPGKPYPLALPKKIFNWGYLHCLIKENDGITKIHVYGKKGKLLKKIGFKDKEGKIIAKETEWRSKGETK